MTYVFKLKLNLQSSAHQPQLIQYFKDRGDDVIQTGDGLCAKTTQTLDELKSALSDKGLSEGVAIEPLDANAGDLPKDIQAFLGR